MRVAKDQPDQLVVLEQHRQSVESDKMALVAGRTGSLGLTG